MGRRSARSALPPRAGGVSAVGCRGRSRGRGQQGRFSKEWPDLWVCSPSLTAKDIQKGTRRRSGRRRQQTRFGPGAFRAWLVQHPCALPAPSPVGVEFGGVVARSSRLRPPIARRECTGSILISASPPLSLVSVPSVFLTDPFFGPLLFGVFGERLSRYLVLSDVVCRHFKECFQLHFSVVNSVEIRSGVRSSHSTGGRESKWPHT